MAYKLLYANGCSMTEGAELGNKQFGFDEKRWGPNNTVKHQGVTHEHALHMKAHAWPAHLAKLLHIGDIQNSATGGSCNDRILRSTVKDIHELLKGYKPDEIFVSIGWSNGNRYEVMNLHNTEEFWQVVPGHKLESMPKDLQAYCKLRDKWISSNFTTNVMNLYLNMLSLKNYLEHKGIKYVFCLGIAEMPLYFYDESALRAAQQHGTINALFDENEYAKNPRFIIAPNVLKDGETLTNETMLNRLHDLSFCTYSNKMGFPYGNGLHPLEEAHFKWALVMHDYIIKRNLL